MTETKKVEVEQEVSEEVEAEGGKATANEQDKTGKVFTQADLDKAIQARVRREKSTFETERTGWETERKDFETKASEYEGVIKEIIAEKSADFAPAVKVLFDKLSIKEQWEYLKTPEFALESKSKVSIPRTPKTGEDAKPKYTRLQHV